MLPSQGLLLSDADALRRRAYDHFLPLRVLHTPVEGKLKAYAAWRLVTATALFAALASVACAYANPLLGEPFSATREAFRVVLFMCVWQRPHLTHFVLNHYNDLRAPLRAWDIELEIFLVGSDNATTPVLARAFDAGYAVHPNSPLGRKHDAGLQSLRDHYARAVEARELVAHPDAVAIVGSDDVLNARFFVIVEKLMRKRLPRRHVVGLRDLSFYDLKTQRLVYTRGYRSFKTPISGTLGCGRVFSWDMLEAVEWHVWDVEREHGLDQSAIRNVMLAVPLVGEVSEAVYGKEEGVLAVDVKTDGFGAGTNIWRFEQVVEAVGKNGRLHDFDDADAATVLGEGFGVDFVRRLQVLREEMKKLDDERT